MTENWSDEEMSMISEQIEELEKFSTALAIERALAESEYDKQVAERKIKLIHSAIATIRELSAKVASESMERSSRYYNGGWIPCEDALPERNKTVLCWVKSTTIASGETYILGSCDKGFWFLRTYEIGHELFPVKAYKVMAWMPLPKPYKEKKTMQKINDEQEENRDVDKNYAN